MKKLVVLFIIYWFSLSRFTYSDALEKNLKKVVAKYLYRTDYKNAKKACIAFISKHPNRCFAYSLLGRVYEELGELEKAEQAYKNGIERNPRCYKLYFNLSKIYFTLGKYKMSLNYLLDLEKYGKEAIKKADINLFDFYKLLGKNYFILKDYYGSIKYFEESLKYKWNEFEIYSFLQNAYNNISDKDFTQAYFELGNLVQKRKDLSKREHILYSGIIFLKHKKYQRALDKLIYLYDQYEDERDNIILNFDIGLGYLLLKNYYNALEYLERAVYLYKKKTKLKYFLIRLLRIESRGAKYHLVLSLAYYLNHEYEMAYQTHYEIKNYDIHIYKSFPYRSFAYKGSKIYKELPHMYEFP